MRVYGEAYLFINFWMDFLSLLLAACLRRVRFRGARAAVGAAVGAVLSLLARSGAAFLCGFPAALIMILVTALVSFGKAGFALFPWTAASALLLCGLTDALLRNGASAASVMIICGIAALVFCLVQRRQRSTRDGACVLRVSYRGKSSSLPVLRDSGNRLRDGLTGQPVIVAPESALLRLIPCGVRPANIATLPRGWRLLPIRTAAGNGLVMCFRPDAAMLVRNGKAKRLDVTIALSSFEERAALVPEELFIG